MRVKRIVSVVVAAIGVVVIIYAMSSMSRISEAKGNVRSINSAISGSSTGRMIGGGLSSKASQYDTEVMVLLIAGIVLTIGGCIGAYRFRKR
ncbi:MAG TPA: hypothetical protein VGO47_02580 [Chlamydiales bacterium]|jgi:hypothetical protein|nr:hypothetical protein [Chlamydiales bacterium]